jgi:hypothetical protein
MVSRDEVSNHSLAAANGSMRTHRNSGLTSITCDPASRSGARGGGHWNRLCRTGHEMCSARTRNVDDVRRIVDGSARAAVRRMARSHGERIAAMARVGWHP